MLNETFRLGLLIDGLGTSDSGPDLGSCWLLGIHGFQIVGVCFYQELALICSN